MNWVPMFGTTLSVLLFPYLMASIVLTPIIYGPGFLCMKLAQSPLYILFGLENRCCDTYNACTKYINHMIKFIAFITTILWLPILNIFICTNSQYFNAILLQLSLILMNTINHLIILCLVPSKSILALLTSISCRITIFYILLSIFIFTYGHLSKQIINYKRYRYIASLTICIELLMAFIYVYITFIVQYDDDHHNQYVFTIIGFVNYIYPNFPFRKSALIIKFAYSASQEWLVHFVLNGSINEMYNRFYFALHHVTFHDPSKHQKECHMDETVHLLINTKPQKNVSYHHELNDIKCLKMQYKFLKMDIVDKVKYIDALMSTHNEEDIISRFDFGICRTIYVVSSFVACVFPVIWLLLVFESSLVSGWTNLLIYGSIIMFVGFLGRMMYFFFKMRISPNYLFLMVKLYDFKIINQNIASMNNMPIKYMHQHSELVLVLVNNLGADIAFFVLPYLLYT